MPRSRRAKSQSVSSNVSEPLVNNINTVNTMAPPSPPLPSTVKPTTPTLTRHRKAPSTAATNASPLAVSPVSSPVTITRAAPRAGATIPSIPPQRPGVSQFIVIAILSSAIEAVLQSVASQFGAGDLAAVSKRSDNWVEVGGLLGWKLVTVGVMWFGGFDAYDVASLTLLFRTPTLLLLFFFYNISSSTLLITTTSTLLSTFVPFRLFRPLLPQHAPKSHPHAPRALLRNRSILTDPYTTLSTSLLATAIFAVLIELSFSTFLPAWLVVHFDGLRSVEFSHAGPAGLPILLLALIPAGYASMVFLWTPSTGVTDLVQAVTSPLAASLTTFDPATAGFGAHVAWNAWGWYSARQKELITRTIVLGLIVVGETVVESWAVLKGVDVLGALGYAGIWGVGVALVGVVLEWVGGPSD